MDAALEKPVPMMLLCPKCGTQHIDAPDPLHMHDQVACSLANGRGERCTCDAWTNPPHRSHKCHACGAIWRPADICTTGVEAINTRGKHDTWPRLSDSPRFVRCEWSDSGPLETGDAS